MALDHQGKTCHNPLSCLVHVMRLCEGGSLHQRAPAQIIWYVNVPQSSIFAMVQMSHRSWVKKLVWRGIRCERPQRESDWDNQTGFQGKGEVLREFLHTHPWALPRSVPQLCKGRQCISRLSVSLAALISAMNRQLFVFVQQNPGLFMTVYHEGNLAKSSPHLLGVTNKW